MNQLLNFKSFFKFLGKNKMYTVIDVFGLSVSLMFVILIAVYSTQELSVDSFQQKADRIYALGHENGLGSAIRLAYRMEDRYPEIEKVCPMSMGEHAPILAMDKRWNSDILFVDSTFFDLFSFDLLQGDKSRALEAKSAAIISESFARKVFGRENPLGQVIQLHDSVSVTVSAVMKDIRYSAIPYADVLTRVENVEYFNSSLVTDDFSNASGSLVFVLEKEGANLRAKTDDMLTFFKEIFWIYKRDIWKEVRLVPLRDIYFGGGNDIRTLLTGDRRFVLILLSIGILILLFAVINYINLTVAQTGFRAKEMATRRLMGSSRGSLFSRLIMESTLLTFISFGLGLLLAYACVPYANSLLETKLYLSDAITPVSILIALVLIVLLGFLSGLLPATIISNAKPIDVVRGSFRQKTKMVFSKFFITFQQFITIGLVAVSITMFLQTEHLIKAPLGYNTENIIDISTYQLRDKQMVLTLANELKQLACVNRTSMSQGTPFNRGNNYTFEYENRNISLQIINGDGAFFDMLGLQVLRDNQVTSDNARFFNEQAMKEFNLPEDTLSVNVGGETTMIAGIVKDFQLNNIMHKKQPVSLRIDKIENFYPWDILVEVTGDPFVASEDIKQVYERVTQLEYNGKFIDQQIEETFASQKRLSKIVLVFCGIALLISLLGLLAMSTYFIQQRSREIGVRKVFGSTNKEILMKLSSNFLLYVVIAFVLVTPVVWYIMSQWLSDYAYRIALSPLIFIVAGMFCLLASFFTVVWQSYEAANANPVESIKTE